MVLLLFPSGCIYFFGLLRHGMRILMAKIYPLLMSLNKQTYLCCHLWLWKSKWALKLGKNKHSANVWSVHVGDTCGYFRVYRAAPQRLALLNAMPGLHATYAPGPWHLGGVPLGMIKWLKGHRIFQIFVYLLKVKAGKNHTVSG